MGRFDVINEGEFTPLNQDGMKWCKIPKQILIDNPELLSNKPLAEYTHVNGVKAMRYAPGVIHPKTLKECRTSNDGLTVWVNFRGQQPSEFNILGLERAEYTTEEAKADIKADPNFYIKPHFTRPGR